MSYLSPANGFSYDKTRRAPPDPLDDVPVREPSIGYCQQFAGAMALLLRMGGVPARVATGFTTGTLQPGDQAVAS